MNLQGLPKVLLSDRAAETRTVDKYFDSRRCLQRAYKASASRACLLLQEDGPRSSRGCVVNRAEMSQEHRGSATGKKVAESGKRKEAHLLGFKIRNI